MNEGAGMAETLLIGIRDNGNDLSPSDVAAMIEAALPPERGPSRLAFMTTLAIYLIAALAGCPVDPESLH